ncbi:YibE/F family protein [Paramaledivibacter caminithermalis]|uniref:YibE/F family protein n=1 Tax=Paramaledivibacter caminithermalis TaxID=191027 RepID=UPI0009334698
MIFLVKRILALILLIFAIFSFYAYGEEDITTFEKALVLQVVNDENISDENINGVQFVELKILTGKYKGKTFNIENVLSDHPVYDIPVKKGDKVLVFMEVNEEGNLEVNITDYVRNNYIYILVLIFVIILLLIGRIKGLKTILTLVFTMLMIFKVLLPLMLRGYNAVFITILISAIVTIVTITIISGFSKKSAAAVIGTVSGVLIAGFIAFIIGTKVKLTGLSSEEAVMLSYIPQDINFNFRDLLFSGILLGTLGAVMDVSMSIASAIEEINRANSKLSMKELFISGMNVGKDIMGTMSNTLILAYTGSTVPLMLLFMAYETSFLRISNMDIIATEIIRSLAGSIGLILAIPLTAVISAMLIKKE